MNAKTLDALGKIILSQESSEAIINQVDINDGTDYAQITDLIFSSNVSLGDYINSKIAESVFNPLIAETDFNETIERLQNPLILNFGSTQTNDSNVPQLVSSGYYPVAAEDLNNSIDINCFSEWSDDTIIDRIDLRVTGPDMDINYYESKLSQTASINYAISSSLLTGGNITCEFTASDIASNSTVQT